MPTDPRAWLRDRRAGGSLRVDARDPRAWLQRRRGFTSVPDDELSEPAQPEATWGDTAITTALRVVPSVAGTLGGAFLGGTGGFGVGAGPGAILGGGAGAAAGEAAAEGYEKFRGLRKMLSPGSIAVEAALGAVPLGKTATVGSAALKGAGLSAVGAGAHRYVEEGELPSPGETGLAALLGAGFGSAGHALLSRLLTPKTAQEAAGTAGEVTPVREWLAARRAQAADRDADVAYRVARARGMVDPTTGEVTNPRGNAGFLDYADRDLALQEEIRRPAQRESGARTLEPPANYAPFLPAKPKPPSSLLRFLQRQNEISAGADRESRGVIPGPEATVPRSVLEAPIPPKATWEQVDPRIATQEEQAMQSLVPRQLLQPGSAARRRRENEALANLLRMQREAPAESANTISAKTTIESPAAEAPPPVIRRGEAPRAPVQVGAVDAGGRMLPIFDLDGRQIALDPQSYQFKEADARGSTGALKGVSKWDPLAASANPVVVHERADGSLFVADGHQRVNKWNELAAAGQDMPPIRAVVLREVDGYDLPTVRRIVSLKNVREGSADPIDIAKLLRTGPLSEPESATMPRGSVAGPKLAQAEGLSRLGPHAFQAVVNREVPSTWGAIVSRLVPDEAQQLTMVRALANADIAGDVEAEALVKELLRGDFTQVAMTDMFGESSQMVSLAEQIAKIVGKVSATLGRQKRTFNAAVKNASTLETAGNKLARAENERRANEASTLTDWFQFFNDKQGSQTRDAMKALAARIVKGEANLGNAAEEIIPAVRRDIDAEGVGIPGGAGRAPNPADQPAVPSTAGSAVRPRIGDANPASAGRPVEELRLTAEPPAAAPQTDLEPPPITRAELEAAGQKNIFGDDEKGFILNRLGLRAASSAAGGTVGFAAGASSADEDATPRERLARGAAGAAAGIAAGAVAPSALARILRVKPTAISTARTAGVPQEAIEKAIRTVAKGERPGPVTTVTGRATRGPIVTRAEPATSIPATKPQPKQQRETFLRVDKFPAAIQPAIKQLGEDVGLVKLEQQRRGRQSIARREALASQMRVEAKKLRAGTNLNAEETEAYIDAFTSMVAEAEDTARLYRDNPTDANGLKLLQLNAAKTALLSSVTGLRSEQGRALNVWKKLRAIQPAELRLAQEFTRRGRLRSDMDELSQLLGDLPKDPAEAMKKLMAMEKQGALEKVTSYYMANILSGVQTYNRNLLGNAANMVSRIAVKGAGAPAVDALKSMLTGRPRQVFTREALHETIGATYAVNSAIRDAMDVMKNGFSSKALEEGLQGTTDLYLPKREFAGGVANPFNLPGRVLEATDRFFVTLNRNAELYGQSYGIARREAAERKLSGERFLDFVAKRSADLRANPTPELQRSTMREAEYATFREEPGPFANSLIQMKKKIPAVGFVIPFVRTVSNIFRQGIEHTPVGFFMKRALSEDPREATIAQGRAAVGSLMALPIVYAASTGRLSGAGPKDPADRAALYELGWRPNSIKMSLPAGVARTIGASESPDGEYWVNYSLFQPFSIPAAIIANAVESYDELSRKGTERSVQQSAEELVAQTIARVANTAISQTYMQGIFGLVGALENPEAGAVRFARQLARGFVPLSGALQSGVKATDPIYREADTLEEELQRVTPGLSKNLRPRLDRFGRPIERTGSALRRGALVPEVEPVKRDRVTTELERLGIRVSVPTARIDLSDRRRGQSGRQLTREEAYSLREVRGQTSRAAIARVVGSPGYDALPDFVKRERIEDALSRSGRRTSRLTRTAFTQNRPDLIQSLRARAQRQLGQYDVQE